MTKAVPGIYVSEQQYVLNPLQIRTDCIAAFAGITERGPLNCPVFIQNFDMFLKIFGGFDCAGVLALSVYSYFKCGERLVLLFVLQIQKMQKKPIYL